MGTDIQTAAVQLMLVWDDYPGSRKPPCRLSRNSCMTDVWQSSCYIYYLSDWLNPWSTAFLKSN
jgi:hypothetical protein